ncbi:MAG: tRNA epoxyqueuosine(34) reductase QueG [Agarilytica sp.]
MNSDYELLARKISDWAKELGFQDVGIAEADTSSEKVHLEKWLNDNYHGSMAWMEERKDLRLAPQKLVPGSTRIISARMDYLPAESEQIKVLKSPEKAYLSRYALGRDYHKLIRKRLAQLAKKIEAYCEDKHLGSVENQRAFVDSAPVLERPLAKKAGLGWVGKHTLLINPHAGSWFFLGEIFTNLPLPVSRNTVDDQCGDCQACMQVCPTDAFPRPYVLDARRCISYLTIEHKGAIPEKFREPMGNRVFGCDDCQAICPWNKYASFSQENDFQPRHNLNNSDLLTLFLWTEDEFLNNTAGSPIRRIGYENWLRNLSIGLGNAPTSSTIIAALQNRLNQSKKDWLCEHYHWAIAQQERTNKRRKRKIKRSLDE